MLQGTWSCLVKETKQHRWWKETQHNIQIPYSQQNQKWPILIFLFATAPIFSSSKQWRILPPPATALPQEVAPAATFWWEGPCKSPCSLLDLLCCGYSYTTLLLPLESLVSHITSLMCQQRWVSISLFLHVSVCWIVFCNWNSGFWCFFHDNHSKSSIFECRLMMLCFHAFFTILRPSDGFVKSSCFVAFMLFECLWG